MKQDFLLLAVLVLIVAAWVYLFSLPIEYTDAFMQSVAQASDTSYIELVRL